MKNMQIRQEEPSDGEAIAEMIRLTYKDVPFSNHREHLMVERLRASSAYLPQLTLIAELDGAIAGHIMMTAIQIRGAERDVNALALAPLSVAPMFQRRGVGGALIQEAHARARNLGFAAVILVGITGYYHRFGYGPLDAHGITLPFDVHADQRMALELSPRALAGVHGTVEYAPEWLER